MISTTRTRREGPSRSGGGCGRAAIRSTESGRAASRQAARAPAARSASGAQLPQAHAALAQMARKDAVVIEIEARLAARLGQLGELGFRTRGAEGAPAVHQMNLGEFGVPCILRIPLDDAHRAAVGPVRRLEARERPGNAGRMLQPALSPVPDAG